MGAVCLLGHVQQVSTAALQLAMAVGPWGAATHVTRFSNIRHKILQECTAHDSVAAVMGFVSSMVACSAAVPAVTLALCCWVLGVFEHLQACSHVYVLASACRAGGPTTSSNMKQQARVAKTVLIFTNNSNPLATASNPSHLK